MRFSGACIPLGGAWCSLFVRWQGSLAEVNLSIDFASVRYEQFDRALADDRAFQKRRMVPAALPNRKRGAEPKLIDADEGIFPTTRDGLAALKPVLPDGATTTGMQTHPADGTAGALITTEQRARDIGQRAWCVSWRRARRVWSRRACRKRRCRPPSERCETRA